MEWVASGVRAGGGRVGRSCTHDAALHLFLTSRLIYPGQASSRVWRHWIGAASRACAGGRTGVDAAAVTFEAGGLLLDECALAQPADELALLARWQAPHALYVPLAARLPLVPAEWSRLPVPCPGLGAALPAVLRRSDAVAALLVSHLPAGERGRLRTGALCLARAQHVHGMPPPVGLLRMLLAAAAE